MKKVDVPEVVHIVIDGPVQCGKYVVMDRIEKLLRLAY